MNKICSALTSTTFLKFVQNSLTIEVLYWYNTHSFSNDGTEYITYIFTNDQKYKLEILLHLRTKNRRKQVRQKDSVIVLHNTFILFREE